MVTKFRACFWALSFGLFLHMALEEHLHGILLSFCKAVFWTIITDRITSGAIERPNDKS